MTSLFSDHLSLDAVVAFADGELGMLAYQRAAAHVARCPNCAAEVAEQTTARDRLRSASAPKMPGSLFDQLRSIPVALPAPPAVPGAEPMPGIPPAGIGPQQHDPAGSHRTRRFRMSAGFLVAGIAVSALAATAAAGEHPDPQDPVADPGRVPSSTSAQPTPTTGSMLNLFEPVVHRPR